MMWSLSKNRPTMLFRINDSFCALVAERGLRGRCMSISRENRMHFD